LKCCGIDKPEDWQLAPPEWPASCCYSTEDSSRVPDGEKPTEHQNCQAQNNEAKYVYNTGCFQKMKEKIEGNSKVLIGVGIGIAFVEVKNRTKP